MKKYITTITVEAYLVSIDEAEKIIGHIEIDPIHAILKTKEVYLIKDEDGNIFSRQTLTKNISV